MSLFPGKNKTAIQCSVRFRELMKQRHEYWAENVHESTKNIEEEEFPHFLRWMADPTGSVPGLNKNMKVRTVEPSIPSFFTDPNFVLTGTQNGRVPLFKFDYVGNRTEDEQEDEKIE